MKKKIIIIVGSLIVVVGLITIIVFSLLNNDSVEFKDVDMKVVLSMEDEFKDDALWCGTLNLAWTELQEELVQEMLSESTPLIDNLNNTAFNKSYLNNTSYYLKYGLATHKLKEEMEAAIKEKFDEESEILDSFNWYDEDTLNYLVYVMLKKEFNFPAKYEKLEKDTFNNEENVNYFGVINNSSKYKDQIEVLYYNDKENFAIKLLTKEKEEIILSRGTTSNNFKNIYEEIVNNTNNYEGSNSFRDEDSLMIPYLNFKIKKEFTELENNQFLFKNNKEYYIDKAIQTIEFELGESGGKIKSEAGMNIDVMSAQGQREFLFNKTFTIFLKEEDKDLPYFAARISSIKELQNN